MILLRIRARMKELRRERAQMSAARDTRSLCPSLTADSDVFWRAIRPRVRDGISLVRATRSGARDKLYYASAARRAPIVSAAS